MGGPPAIRLLLAYEGTRYVGWQHQPNGLSVQAVLEGAFQRLSGCSVRAVAASRTDSGVHAAGQVVLLPNPSRHDPNTIRRGLNALLPEDISVREAAWAEPGFEPRHHARGKHYRYRIFNRSARPVFERALVWHLRRPLDLDAMQAASELLRGEHDFSAFRAANCPATSPVRSLDRVAWSRRGDELHLDVLGRSFLKQMVRNLVGTLVEVGWGRLRPQALTDILASRDRRRAARCAPAQGLCLLRVFYAPEEYARALASRD
ncbi:MAG TPA: tRNA pseudouridine(38-40) synthase TruA [Myxococcota bacterium]|nr:tRNA pseudouridine(38-40) synthase TruA [Myxococcota bacterium]HRY95351.1 tRNA pseudouridine(38-40) synthase TruA [Myxococcota bacterium]HSA21194.1 tRNA pseudouridine(38-40) synthase TruA [Myxococcota bacterium]